MINVIKVVLDMVYFYNADGISTLHGYLGRDESIEEYMIRNNLIADVI